MAFAEGSAMKCFDQMIAGDARFCWLFTYMPVSSEAVPELMVSAGQRKFMLQGDRGKSVM